MVLRTINSGSKGNCYILSDDSDESLILDAGVKSAEIKRELYFNFSLVSGVLITHGHGDHNLSADELELYGLNVWRPYLVDGGRDRKVFGKYAVESFPVEHDGTPCCGFYIRHISGFKMLYVTDFEFCKWNFGKLNVDCILCECNWDREYVNTDSPNAMHKILGHASTDVCKGFIEANVSEYLQAVIICHSSNAVDITKTLEEIKEIAGNAMVTYAARGSEIHIGSVRG